jgi:hypothetical protein
VASPGKLVIAPPPTGVRKPTFQVREFPDRPISFLQ